METATWATIVIAAIGFLGTSLISFFKVGKIAKGIEVTSKDVEEMSKSFTCYKEAHAEEHKKNDDMAHENNRRIAGLDATVDGFGKWLERIELKLDNAISRGEK
ncbi:hypothetical protein M0R72_15890 [Candidatus Pacearchaeota archaeon]|jgi:hypothetical protein|nr:hypothetical protein [Candidatus Pacearchaeota archaeon]